VARRITVLSEAITLSPRVNLFVWLMLHQTLRRRRRVSALGCIRPESRKHFPKPSTPLPSLPDLANK
jgi:hypothetical protein